MKKLYPKQNTSTLARRFATFLERAIEKHGNHYDYSKVEYINAHTPVTIICPIHGEFTQKPYTHISHGCNQCGLSKASKKLRKTVHSFIAEANRVHMGKYSYDKVIYVNSKANVIIECPDHGEFLQMPSNHLYGMGCPTCRQSRGERRIQQYFQEHNISFVPQYKFDDCINPSSGRKLSFDFFLIDFTALVEYDGFQHFYPTNFFNNNTVNPHDQLMETQKRDKIKTEFAANNNIPLLRIRYTSNITTQLSLFVETLTFVR